MTVSAQLHKKVFVVDNNRGIFNSNKKTMKNLIILICMLIAALAASLVIKTDTFSLIDSKKPEWEYKQQELRDRLLAVPILLYHNIDGRGPFSISKEKLREHFELMRKHNVTIIPLRKLVARFDHPAPYNKKVAVITFDDGFLSIYTKLLPLVREYNYPVTLFVYTDFVKGASTTALTWKLLQELESNGIDIQCHSKAHLDLTRLSRETGMKARHKLYEEIYQSKQIIEFYLEKKISFFAFPYGRYNLDIIDLAQQAGYSRVFSTDYGSNIVTRNNYCLKRHHIKREYTNTYIEKLVLTVF